jgi:uncharacterized protein YqeY
MPHAQVVVAAPAARVRSDAWRSSLRRAQWRAAHFLPTVSLKDRINDEVKAAMRAQDKRRLGVLRLITAAVKQKEVDERITLDDAQVMTTLEKMIKQRRDSIQQYQAGNRPDLAEQEQFEIDIIRGFLPAQLSEAEIDAAVAEVIAATGAASARDMGKVMGALKPKLAGKADMTVVSARVKQKLGA